MDRIGARARRTRRSFVHSWLGAVALAPVLMSGMVARAQVVATTVTLTVSNNAPTYITPASPGAPAALQPIVLTATVHETLSGNPVTGGTITFYDLASLDRTQYSDPIGAASIQGPPAVAAAGEAKLYFALGPGTHRLTAVFSGTATWLGSTTAGPLSLNAVGQARASATLDIFGPDGNMLTPSSSEPAVYSNLSVFGYGMQYPFGTGSVTDQTTSALYGPGTYTERYSALGSTMVMDAPAAGVTSFLLADPFRAGVPSIIGFYSTLNQVWTIDINRTQAGPAAANVIGCIPCSVAASPVQGVAIDVNSDGLTDLLIAHNDTTGGGASVGVLLNTLNLDPSIATAQQTFGSAETVYRLGHPIAQVVAGDFNGDGKPDIIALTADGSNLMIVLMNDGAGHFTQQTPAYLGGNGAVRIALADLQVRGILDLAVLNSTDNTFGVLHGNGDGTFQAMSSQQAAPSGVGAVPATFIVTDLNRDGYPDVVIASAYDPSLSNNGTWSLYVGVTPLYGGTGGILTRDDTYRGLNISASGTFSDGIQAGDIDGDGFPDLVISNLTHDRFFPQIYDTASGNYLIENGYSVDDASFRSPSVAIGDVNGDGVPDVVLMTPNNQLYPANPAKASITIFLNTLESQFRIPDLIAGPEGAHPLSASYVPSAGSIYDPVTTSPVVVSIPKPAVAMFTPSSINFGSVAVGSPASQQITLTNTGTGPLSVASVFLSNAAGGAYTETDTCMGVVINPGDPGCTITVNFAPNQSGPFTGALTVSDSAIDSPQLLNLSGAGTSGPTGTPIGTTIVLTSSNTSPAYLTPVFGGSTTTLNPVVLTATVTVTVSGTPVTAGSVTFYDNIGFPGGIGPDVIGTVNVQFPAMVGGSGNGAIAGTASIPFAFGPGPHHLSATYSGTMIGPPITYGYASSSTASPLTLTSQGFAAEAFGFSILGLHGTEVTLNPQVSLSSSFTYANQDPTSSAPFVIGYGMQVPYGVTSVTDTTTGATYPMMDDDYSDGTRNIYTPQLTSYTSAGAVVGNYTYNLPNAGISYFFTADIFQSGVPALITLSASRSQIWTNNLYSNPNNYTGCTGGTNVGGNTTCAVSTPPVHAVAADVNGDGRLDLVVAHNDPTGSGSVGVFANTLNLPACAGANNCSAFNAPEMTYATGHPAGSVAVGDLNGDGYPDIVAVSSDGANVISVLLNKGDGTFALSATNFIAGGGASHIALGDFNQDGVLDIAVLNTADATIGILTGNGNDTFLAMVPYPVGAKPTAFSVADLNLDGTLDFAITNSDSSVQAEVSFLYGQMGGGFIYASNPGVNRLDLATFNFPEANPQPTAIQITDLNGDGYPDLFIGFNINQFIYALWSPLQGHYVYSQTWYPDQDNGINLRTNSAAIADLDGDGVKDWLLMTEVNNNIVCGGCSPDNNNLMFRYNGAMVYGWNGPDVIFKPVGFHTITSAYNPAPGSIYKPANVGPITLEIITSADVSMTPTTVNFGFTQIGTTSPPQRITLKNVGNATLTNIHLTVTEFDSPYQFSEADSCSDTLAPDASCDIFATFHPQSTASYIGYVLLTYGSGFQQYVTLTGTGSTSKSVNVNETITLTDASAVRIAKMVGVDETITVRDASTARVAREFDVSETVRLTDAPTLTVARSVDVSEVVTLTDTSQPLTFYPTSTTIQVPKVVTLGSNIAVTATVKAAGTVTVPTGQVTFFADGAAFGVATLSGGVASFPLSSLSQGVHSMSASFAGSSTFGKSDAVAIPVNITLLDVLYVVPQVVSRIYGINNPVLTYSIVNSIAAPVPAITGAPVLSTTAVAASPGGTYPIVAGTGTLSAGPNYTFVGLSGKLTITGAPQTISFLPLPNLNRGVTAITMTAYSTSGQTIHYSVTGPAIVIGSLIVLSGPGNISVTAMQPGNANFLAAKPITRTFTVYP